MERRQFIGAVVTWIAFLQSLALSWMSRRKSEEPKALPIPAPVPDSRPKLVEVRYLRDLKWDAENCILTPIYGSLLLPEGCVPAELEDKDGNPL